MSRRGVPRSAPNPHPLADFSCSPRSAPLTPSPEATLPETNLASLDEEREQMLNKSTQTDLTSADIERLFDKEKAAEASSVVADVPKRYPSYRRNDGIASQPSEKRESTSQRDQRSGVPKGMYLIGGSTNVFSKTVEAYDGASEKWREVCSIPPEVEWMMPAVTSWQECLYVIGETDFQRDNRIGTLWRRNPNEQEHDWEMLSSLSMPRVNPCLLSTASGLYALGGRFRDQSVNNVDHYDPQTDTWTSVYGMTKPRCYFGAAAANGALYAVDGMKDSSVVHKTTEMLDPREGKWSYVGKKGTKGRTAFGCVHYNQAIYLIGGISPYTGTTLVHENSTQIFDLRMNSWRGGATLRHRRAWLAAGVVDDVLCVVGGRSTFGPNAVNAPMECLQNEAWAAKPEVVEVSGHRAFASACVMVT